MEREMLAHSPANLHDMAGLQKIEVAEGLALRPLAMSHAEGLLSILEDDPTIRNRVSVASRLHSSEDVAREIETISDDPELIRYVIEADGGVVGLISFWKDSGFFGQPPDEKAYGFGFFLDPRARGKGVVGRSVQRLMGVAQQELDIKRFIAFCEDDNVESRAVLLRAGFQPTPEIYDEPSSGWQERKYVFEV